MPRVIPATVPFSDLRPIVSRHREALAAAVTETMAGGWYILGPRVERFEAALAAYTGRRHAVGVANGTDAIQLALRGHGIGPGDEVITVSHTAVATVAAIEAAGATPVLVDIEPDTFNIDPAAVRGAITGRTAAIVAVHLYGHPAAMGDLAAIASAHGLLLVGDCAQALGANVEGRPVGALGDIATFSFYPTKTLGALGDAGAVVTDDDAVAQRLRRLRNYGQEDRYRHLERGINSRMDELQAAILSVLLPHLDHHNDERRRLAGLYRERLEGVVTPVEAPGAHHVYHLYVVRAAGRDRLQAGLASEGIGTLIHYPVPVHLQPAYAGLGVAAGALPVTERVAAEILSLPLYVGLEPAALEAVAGAVSRHCRPRARA